MIVNGKCSVCDGLVPHNLISCPWCAVSKSAIAERIAQVAYMERAITGEIELRIYKSDDFVKHIQKWATDVTFCGEATKGTRAKQRRSYLWISDTDEINKLCPECRDAFRELETEVRASTLPPAA